MIHSGIFRHCVCSRNLCAVCHDQMAVSMGTNKQWSCHKMSCRDTDEGTESQESFSCCSVAWQRCSRLGYQLGRQNYHDTPEVFSVQSQCSCFTQIFESSLCVHIKLWKAALCLPETPPSIMMFVMCHKTQSLESVFGSKSNRNHQTSKTLVFSFKHQDFHQSQDYSRKQFSSQNHCFYLPSPPLKLIKNPSIS